MTSILQSNMETLEIQDDDKTKTPQEYNVKSKHQGSQDLQMTSSTVSSLPSPDSGVQLLDSESEVTSVMSNSGIGCDIDAIPNLECDVGAKLLSGGQLQNDNGALTQHNVSIEKQPLVSPAKLEISETSNASPLPSLYSNYENMPEQFRIENNLQDIPSLTKSDIDNQNVTHSNSPIYVAANLSLSVPNYFDKFSLSSANPSPNFQKFSTDARRHSSFTKSLSDDVFEMEHPIKSDVVETTNNETDLMNVSLNSYELLDYTLQNKLIPVNMTESTDQMHVSMSEEVNENMKISQVSQSGNISSEMVVETPVTVENEVKPVEDQIVFRRQRKKKSRSDTPKKRVSFHEDILNSTKIDDIHINHGFITHESDVSLSFFQRGFIRKPDVVKGRYSWAAEGDAPFYEKPTSEREVKSDIYVHNPRFSSTSSSSMGSSGSTSSSIDEEDSPDENQLKKVPTQRLPKSSCLKKTKKKCIDTKIVHEENINLRKKKSENNLLDSNIFGSLKNILNFSTSVPLAERGVPEGQEDVGIYSSSHDISNRRRSCSNITLQNYETPLEIKPIAVQKATTVIEPPKPNLKLTKSEGFYPNYPNNQALPTNIILCDSNVYEHKGISYSYEYDKFQKTFEQQTKPKSSTVYQMILNELNFFRRKAKTEPDKDPTEDFEFIHADPEKKENDSPEDVSEPIISTPKSNLSRYASTTKLDWSDNDTVSELTETNNSRHLNSPKRKIKKNNHYSVQSPFKTPPNFDNRSDIDADLSLNNPIHSLRPASSKSSLINRFLKNVTLKKMLDMKAQNKAKNNNKKYMSLYVKGGKKDMQKEHELQGELDREILLGKQRQIKKDQFDMKLVVQFKKDLFRNRLEKLLRVFPVYSAYSTNGDSKPLLVVLTNATLYIAGLKSNNCYCNYFVLPYTDLNTILVGPNSQTIYLSNYDQDMQCIISTGCASVTSDLIGQIEIAMRRDINKPALPAVKHLNMRDMANLRKAICKQTSVDKEEEYFYYSIVHIQDFIPDAENCPMGPNKEGPLMFKTTNSVTRWETAYFILKAGVLYMLSSASQRVPMRVFPLINGSCQGARRVHNCPRPHTFQLIIEGKSLQLAAPDEYVCSDWLQALVHAASGAYNQHEKQQAQSCTLMMTSEHILTVREAFPCTITSLLPSKSLHEPIKGPQALSCASVVDLTAFRLPSAEQSWCILEFACREVHECSGDWILYFSSNAELERFISTLEMLWAYNNENGDSFPLTTIPETDPLSKRCVDIYNSLRNIWPSSAVHLQFL